MKTKEELLKMSHEEREKYFDSEMAVDDCDDCDDCEGCNDCKNIVEGKGLVGVMSN
jgi:hypothetical protein